MDRHDGRLIRRAVGKNRKEAERALDAHRGDVARRTYKIVQDIRFDEWAASWLAAFAGKENSRRVYAHSIAYAKKSFGDAKVRDLTPDDVRRFLDAIRDANAKRAKTPERTSSLSCVVWHRRRLRSTCASWARAFKLR